MKIYSWNMLFSNKRLDEAFEFIKNSDFDIFCLQEVPEDFLAHLRTLPSHLHAASEARRRYRGAVSTQYVAILSRYPIEHHESFPLPYRDPQLPWCGRRVVDVMVGLGIFGRGLGERHGIYADVQTAAGRMRVFCLHLSLTNPAWRTEELEIAMRHKHPSLPTIVCGDFNILETHQVGILNFLFGGHFTDVLARTRERRAIEKKFFTHRLANPHRGRSTHPISGSQLDHILVSDSFSIKNAAVLRNRYGSDHCPIFVEITHTAT